MSKPFKHKTALNGKMLNAILKKQNCNLNKKQNLQQCYFNENKKSILQHGFHWNSILKKLKYKLYKVFFKMLL